MSKPPLLYISLGIVAMVSLGAQRNQVVPATSMAVVDTGLIFPDGTTQSTAFLGVSSVPDDIYRSGCAVTKSSALAVGQCDLPRIIPMGKRLVIETVTGTGYADNYMLGTAYLSYPAPLGTGSGPLQIRVAFPWVEQLPVVGTRRFFGFHQATTLYVDGPITLQFNVFGSSSTGTNDYSLEFTVSGYLVDL